MSSSNDGLNIDCRIDSKMLWRIQLIVIAIRLIRINGFRAQNKNKQTSNIFAIRIADIFDVFRSKFLLGAQLSFDSFTWQQREKK